MGQHKRNPTAKAAKMGGLLPKKPELGAAERRKLIEKRIEKMLVERGCFFPIIKGGYLCKRLN